jgi:flagellar L-ring protein precursor FlgH
MKSGAMFAAVMLAATASSGAEAADLFKQGSWSALAADPKAAAVGDSLTVVVVESASASNSTLNDSKKGTRLSGELAYGSNAEAAALALSGASEGGGQTGRSGRMVAQLGVVVDEVLPNGDLRVSGQHVLKINGEETHIRLRGRVRRMDIASDNSIISSRLADVEIEYDGSGFLSRNARPGIVSQIFSMLGLM